MMIADWIDALEEFPQEAVERAIRERIRSGDRARPLPGEIRAMARKFLEPAPRESAEVVPFRPPTAEELAERQEHNRQVLERLAKEFPDRLYPGGTPRPVQLKRMTTSEADL